MALILEQKISEKASPAVIQLVTMIQMTSAEMNGYINEIAQENPVFELEPISVHDIGIRAPRRNALKTYDMETEGFSEPEYSEADTLYYDICMQLESARPGKALLANAKFLAGFLDDSAYIAQEDFAFAVSILGEASANEAIKLIQNMSPAGVGARDLSECLCLQLRRLPENTDLAEKIAENYLDILSKGHYLKIARLLGANSMAVQTACTQIRSLNPRPGSIYESNIITEFINPDLFVEDNGDVSLNVTRIPKIRINNYYRNLLKESDDPEVLTYLNEKFQQADSLASNIQLRNSAILQCTKAIVQWQQSFFSYGDRGLIVPLTRSQIASQTGLSESTVSRAVAGKFIQCIHGTYPLSSFFSAALDGGETQMASTAIRERIKAMISGEDKTEPLSDQGIADILSQDGILLSRRTVAKYRQQLNIPGTFARCFGCSARSDKHGV